MRAVMWRLAMGVLGLVEFAWLLVAVPALWLSRCLARWSEVAELEWLVARQDVRGRRR